MKMKDKFKKLEEKIKENNLDVDIAKIENAFVLAYESHVGQKRKSGEDFKSEPRPSVFFRNSKTARRLLVNAFDSTPPHNSQLIKHRAGRFRFGGFWGPGRLGCRLPARKPRFLLGKSRPQARR